MKFDESAVYRAIIDGDKDGLQRALESGREDVKLKDETGRSFLHLAVDCSADVDVIRCLLQHVDVSERDEMGDSILDKAAEIEGSETEAVIREHIENIITSGNVEELQKLVLAGCQVPRPSSARRRHIKDKLEDMDAALDKLQDFEEKARKLHEYAENGDAEQLQRVVENKAIAAVKDVTGMSVLHKAVVYGHPHLVRLIIDQYPSLLNRTDNLNRTALHYAATARDGGHVYKILLTAGSDEGATDVKGNTPKTYLEDVDKLRTNDVIAWINQLRLKPRKRLRSRPASAAASEKGMSDAGSEKRMSDAGSEKRMSDAGSEADAEIKQSATKPGDDVTTGETEAEKNGQTEISTNGGIKDDPYREKAELPKTFDACYLAETLGTVLTSALANVADERPSDPIEYLAKWLYKYAENRDYVIQMKEDADRQKQARIAAEREAERHKQCKQELITQRGIDEALERQRHDNQEIEDSLNNAEGGPVTLPTVKEEVEVIEVDISERNKRDELGRTALHRAAITSEGDVSGMLGRGYDLTIRDVKNMTARDVAATSSNASHVDVFDSHVCKLFEKGDLGSLENLLLGSYKHFPDLGELYGPNGEGLNEEAFNFYKIIPDLQEKIVSAHRAVVDGNLRNLQQQLDRKQMALSVDDKGLGLLHKALLFQKRDIIDYLTSNFPQTIESRDTMDRTPMHYAFALGQDYVELLKQHGASTTVLDLGNHEPCYYENNKDDILLSAGVNIPDTAPVAAEQTTASASAGDDISNQETTGEKDDDDEVKEEIADDKDETKDETKDVDDQQHL